MADERIAAQDQNDLILQARDRITRVVVALQDGSRPALERLAHEALEALDRLHVD